MCAGAASPASSRASARESLKVTVEAVTVTVEPMPAFVVDDDTKIAARRKPAHDRKRFFRVFVRQRIVKGMNNGSDAALSAFGGHIDRFLHGPFAFGYAPVGRLPEGYLRKRERMRSDVFRPDDPVSYFHDASRS